MKSSNQEFLLGGTIGMTAALVNESRARLSNLSKDKFARDWVPVNKRRNLAALWDEYAQDVYPNDDMVLSVRNRFFLGLINERLGPRDTCVIAPCGLTSYPYISTSACHFVELDLPDVMSYKTRRMKWLKQKKILPKLSVELGCIDLLSPTSLSCQVERLPRLGRVVVILEGVSYYIDHQSWIGALQNLWLVLSPGDVVAFDFWPLKDADKEIYKSYALFCRRHGAYSKRSFNFLSKSQLTKIGRGAKLSVASVTECERRLFGSSSLKGRKILRDTYAVFELQ